uniref:Dynactin subunit 6 n=5 Tax=Telluraves TaxID=3073808 RepID=A0A8C0BQ16_9AVES
MLNLVSLVKSLNCPDEPGLTLPKHRLSLSFQKPKIGRMSPLRSPKTLDLSSASELQNAGLGLQFRNPNLPEGSWFEVPKIGRTSPASHRGLGPPPAPAGLFPRPMRPGLGLPPPAPTRRGCGVPGPGSDPTTRLLEPPGVTVLPPEPLLHLGSPVPAAGKPTAGPGSQPRNRPRAGALLLSPTTSPLRSAGCSSSGPRTVIHPKARIIAEAGPIVIGEGNLIEEQALIINGYPENITPETEEVEPKPMVIGTNNVFEVGCYSQAMKVGDNNVIESKAFVGRNVILTSGCIIGACCNVNTYEVIPENTVIYGADCLRRVQTERPQPQTLQLDFLMKILPNYHHLKKTMKATSTPVKS